MNFYSDNSNMPDTEQVMPEDNRTGLYTASRICGTVSITLGILSVTACCLGYLSIPLGALGILFAMLSRRHGQPMPPLCRTGLLLSIGGLIFGIVIFAFHIYATITDPTFWEYVRETMEMYEEIYSLEMNLY